MLNQKGKEILAASMERGWVLEPDAKTLFHDAGLSVPRFHWAHTIDDALACANDIGYPLAAKIVSAAALHKSDVGGVVIGIENDRELTAVFTRLSAFKEFEGVHIEQMAAGTELIIGAKIDPQFGPVILLGIGGTGVEVYKDVAIRMAPLSPTDVTGMIKKLKGRRLLEGYRGAEAINITALTALLVTFSALVMEMAEQIESIDLNPVMASAQTCVIADARIMLKPGG